MYISLVIMPLKRQVLMYNGTAIPARAYSGPEGSRRLRFSDFEAVGT